jgi:hypothetical protein
MQYLDKIDYIGDPVKAVMPGGYYLNTLVASDIPVTDLKVWEFFGYYKFYNPGSRHRFPLIELKFNGVTEQETFIGESIIIYNLLDEMRANSKDAKATLFRIEVSDCGENLTVVISDDGEGVSSHQEACGGLFGFGNTTRSNGLGCALAVGKVQLQKIAGDIKYKGAGIGGKGASFEMSFLKKMPT